jgi:hypothetical protein
MGEWGWKRGGGGGFGENALRFHPFIDQTY